MAIEAFSREAAHGAALLSKMVELALNEVELSPSQYRLLLFLSEEPAAATALARMLEVTRPSLTALVDGLAARGFVTRQSDPEDRRRVTHQISESGREAVLRADEAIRTRLAWLTRSLTEQQTRSANAGLELWLSAIRMARAGRISS